MAAEFPLPSVSSSYPIPAYFELQPEEFVVSKTVYDDGGADYKLQAGGSGVKRWVIRYVLLTLAQAAILDAHLASTFYSPEEGSAIGFTFRHHIPGESWSSTNGTLYANCHYAADGYKVGHTKTWSQSREVIIEKRP
jgi:hypothetical protein